MPIMTTQIHCPYCNASISLPPEAAAQPRILCPRCGDSFANRQPSIDIASGSPPVSPFSAAELPSLPATRLSNAALARWIVSAMIGLAVVSLCFALYTVKFRRGNDPLGKTPPEPAYQGNVPLVAPADLRGLGFLPADCCLVAGFHVAQMLDHADGHKFLDALHSRKLNFSLDQVQQWTGLKSGQIDHLALGMRSEESFQAWTVVIRTASPVTKAALAKAMHPAVATLFEGKPVWRFQQEPTKRMIWWYDEKTVIMRMGFLPVDLTELKQLPSVPRNGAAGLPGRIQAVLNNRLDKQAFLWAAAEVDNIKGLPLLIQLTPQIPPKTKTLLTKIDTFVAGVRFHKGLTLDASFRSQDAETAGDLYKFFQGPAPADIDRSVSEPDPQNWVMLQSKMSLDRAAEALTDPRSLLPAGK